MLDLHRRQWLSLEDTAVWDELATTLKNHEELAIPPYDSKYLSVDENRAGPVADDFETRALRQFVAAAAVSSALPPAALPEAGKMRFPNGQPMFELSRDKNGLIRYVRAVVYEPGCLLDCHQGPKIFDHRTRKQNGKTVAVARAILLGRFQSCRRWNPRLGNMS